MIAFILADLYSQTATGPITLEKKKYYMNGQVIKGKELKSILASNPASRPEYQKFKANMNVASPLIIVGSACILTGAVINLSSSIKEANDVNNGELGNSYPGGLGLILVGAACDLAALPFLFPAQKHLVKSVEDYNASLKTSGRIPAKVDVVLHPATIGIRVTF